MKSAAEIDAYWRSTYPECEPISYWLRGIYADRWVRFHSLPGSKRYAETDGEYSTICERHNAVLSELALPNEELVFVSTGYSGTPTPVRKSSALDVFDSSPQCWRTIPKHQLDHDDHLNYWHLFMSTSHWKVGIFDPILRLIADEVVANTMILSTTNHWIYHAYDGGTDVILKTSFVRDQLKRKFKPWLSSRCDGM